MKKFLAGVFAYFWLTSAAAAGVTCTLPFTLTNGTTADATQVMSNYNALVTCLTNVAAAGANTDITSLLGLATPITPAGGGASRFFAGSATGTANAQVVAATTPTGFANTSGYSVVYIASATNTGATTLAVNAQTAKNVFRMAPGGPQALTGGEIQSGDVVEVIYDGTQFELLSTHNQFGGFSSLTNLTAAATTELGSIASHNANITGTTTITAFGSTASTTYPVYRLMFAGALTLTHNGTSLLLPGTANITTAANDSATALYLGSGNWQITQYQKANGQAVISSTVDVQVFTTPGANTWTRSTGATNVAVFLCGAGGGGAGAARAAAAPVAGGGGGGGGDCTPIVYYKAADAGASQTVTIGTGGTAGAGATVNGNAGTAGGVGGSTTFGSLLTATGGGGGSSTAASGGGGGGGGSRFAAGGTAASAVGGTSMYGTPPASSATPLQLICSGATSAQTGATTTLNSALGCPFGGAGGGATSFGANNATGGVGGSSNNAAPGGGAGGNFGDASAQLGGAGGKSIGCPTAAAGGNGGAGGSTAADFNYHPGCGGGGGGSVSASVGGAGGAGTSGAGGGGGGAGLGANGGAGAAGGNGLAWVLSW